MNPIFSVSQLTLYLKNLFTRDETLARVIVEGEVSNCKYHSSGHLYFTLKDSGSQLKCVMFASARVKGLAFSMKEGDKVQVLGRVSVFERDGNYQMYADRIVLAGLGELYERYEQLKKKLAAEGLFDAAHKKPIPPYPKKIGIVTSRTGAALQDILSILHRRNPYVQPVLAPAAVQGEGASESVVRSLKALIREGADVIIVGRGGGSIEDLWAFNEENVARAVYDCPIPVISCVGHETDTTIIDYVADLRAPTPSAAAEMSVRLAEETEAWFADCHSRLTWAMTDCIQKKRDKIQYMLRLMATEKPDARLERRREQADRLRKDLRAAMDGIMQQTRHRLALDSAALDSLSPLKKLGRGYGFVAEPDGTPVTSVTSKNPGDRIHVILGDGELISEVKEVTPYGRK